MTPIPKAAAPVVWFIRWWVKKPRRLPNARFGALRWDEGINRICPLGLCLCANSPAPAFAPAAGLPEGMQDEVDAFYEWWDSQTDARAAVDAVWPE